MSFNKNFIWGAAAASYQIEGASLDDGKGLSVWDMLCRVPDAIKDGHTGDIACDHYNRYEEDVNLMKEIGLSAYRFSLSWPRILPDGIGKINVKGLDFYDRLIDSLLEKKIMPFVTLFHWDFPYELFKKGGWLNSDSPFWFAEYRGVVVEKFSDRVTNWITLNEPQCFVHVGHETGIHAPGIKLGLNAVLTAGHNALLAHGKSVQVIRSYSKKECQIGYAPVGKVSCPQTESEQDINAARKNMFSMTGTNLMCNTWWMDPVYLGKYPEDGLKIFEKYLPEIKQDDMKTIFQPLDFFGVNIYSGTKIYSGQNGKPVETPKEPGCAKTFFYWHVVPESLYWGPKYFFERYKKPILITENGLSNGDWISLDGKVHDPQRIDFLNRYLLQYKKAGENGVDLKGYFTWSIMDNFEWAEGYNQRFGLIYVDYGTQKRIIKDSGYWYKKIIETNGEYLEN